MVYSLAVTILLIASVTEGLPQPKAEENASNLTLRRGRRGLSSILGSGNSLTDIVATIICSLLADGETNNLITVINADKRVKMPTSGKVEDMLNALGKRNEKADFSTRTLMFRLMKSSVLSRIRCGNGNGSLNGPQQLEQLMQELIERGCVDEDGNPVPQQRR